METLVLAARNALLASLLAMPGLALAFSKPPQRGGGSGSGGIFSAPEFEAGLAGGVVVLVVAAAILIARRRT